MVNASKLFNLLKHSAASIYVFWKEIHQSLPTGSRSTGRLNPTGAGNNSVAIVVRSTMLAFNSFGIV